jgi:hypothetical protein
VALAACGGGGGETPAAENVIEHDFGAYAIEAGGEIDGVCMSWTVGNDGEIWVNAVATENDGFFHHSNWFFVPEDVYDVADGHWNCWEQEFSEVDATLEGGVLYAQSTQTAKEEQRFLPGTAIRIPPRSRIIAYTHLLNPTAEEKHTAVRLRLETLPADEVDTVLTPFRFNYAALAIPPMATSEFSGSCNVRERFEPVMKRPLELKLHWVLPHFHSLGDAFRLALVGGERDGETIFELSEDYGDPLGHRFDEPLDVGATGADGLRFTCGYENPRNDEVGYGIGDQEMCVMLGFAESGFVFDGYVNTTDGVTQDEDGIARGEGACTVIGIPYEDGR